MSEKDKHEIKRLSYNKRQRERRKNNGNKAVRKYEKTKKGFLVRTYRNMKSRIEGIQWRKAHLYKGKYLLGKAEFYEWALNSRAFHTLFYEWELSAYDRKKTPSIDRIVATKGYSLCNMQWITHSENSKKTSRRVFS